MLHYLLMESRRISMVASWARLELCCAPFLRQVRELGPEAVLALTPTGDGPVQVCCGILRRELQEALASAKGPEVEVFEAIRCLIDRQRELLLPWD